MTSPETLPPIAAAPEGASDATKAAATELYKRAGYADDAIKAAGYVAAPPVAPVVTDNTPVRLPPGGTVAIMSGAGISRDQAIAAAKNLLAHGVDADTVAEAALAHGLDPKDFAAEAPSKEAVATQQRDAEVAQGFAPPAKGESYNLQIGQQFADLEPAELSALHADFQEGFAHAGVPNALAQPLLDSFLSTGLLYADEAMTPAGAEARWKEERALFVKTSRNPTEDDAFAVRGFAALPKELQETLTETHAVHSAAALFQLAALGRALAYRASKGGK